MKRIQILSSLAIATLFLQSCSEEKSSDEQPKGETKQEKVEIPKTDAGLNVDTSDLEVELKIAYYHYDSVLLAWDYYKQEDERLRSSMASIESRAKRDAQELEMQVAAKMEKFRPSFEAIGQPTPAEMPEYQQIQEEAMGKMANIESDMQAKLAKAQAKSQNDIRDKLFGYVDQFAEENGFTMIFAKGVSGMAYGHPKMDITKEVISGLNSTYPAEEKK